MSDLTAFRDHATEMATAVHKPDCVKRLADWTDRRQARLYWDIPDPGPRPDCPGCVTDDDRALWARLAAEIDAYLTTDDTALWEDA